jgi:hypothetical protein
MATILGFGAESFVVLIMAVIGLGPVLYYFEKTPIWFTAAYGFLFVAAFATSVEELFLPDVLNLIEHYVGNLGAGVAFAIAAYTYRKQHITAEEAVEPTGEG